MESREGLIRKMRMTVEKRYPGDLWLCAVLTQAADMLEREGEGDHGSREAGANQAESTATAGTSAA